MTTQTQDAATIEDLIEKCTRLCTQAEAAVQDLTGEREAFLVTSLEGALQQVELILRVCGESAEPTRDEDRKGFLRRLFARSDEVAGDGSADGEVAPPTFDVSSQGLQGNSWTVSLAELLGFLAFAGKTGVLWVDSPQENFLVGLVEGQIQHASSDHTPEGLRLGEILVGLGFLTRRQLERFLNQHPDGVSGEALLEYGLINDEELREALLVQVSKLFNRMVNTTNAIFRFQEGLDVQLAYQIRLDVNQLLLDSARTDDEGASRAQSAAALMHEWNDFKLELKRDLSPREVRPTGKKKMKKRPKGDRPAAQKPAPETAAAPKATPKADADKAPPAGDAPKPDGDDKPQG